MISKLLLISSLIVLSACAGAKPVPIPEPIVITKVILPDCGTPPQRPVIDLRPISWKVIDDLFTLSAKGYEDLSYNVTEIWSGVKHLKLEVEYYELCLDNAKIQ